MELKSESLRKKLKKNFQNWLQHGEMLGSGRRDRQVNKMGQVNRRKGSIDYYIYIDYSAELIGYNIIEKEKLNLILQVRK